MPSTIKSSIIIGGKTFEYAEVKPRNAQGAGPRGIRIFIKTRDQSYGFSQNPHDSRKYNKNQESFYSQAALVLGTYYNKSGNKFPRYGTSSFTFDGITFKLTAPIR